MLHGRGRARTGKTEPESAGQTQASMSLTETHEKGHPMLRNPMFALLMLLALLVSQACEPSSDDDDSAIE